MTIQLGKRNRHLAALDPASDDGLVANDLDAGHPAAKVKLARQSSVHEQAALRVLPERAAPGIDMHSDVSLRQGIEPRKMARAMSDVLPRRPLSVAVRSARDGGRARKCQ